MAKSKSCKCTKVLRRLPPFTGYVQTNLVSDNIFTYTPPALVQDPNLLNAWGLARSASSPWWTAANGADLELAYNVSSLAPSTIKVAVESGTGIVQTDGATFPLATTPPSNASFIFASEDGSIYAWSSVISVTGNALNVYTGPAGSIYKGLALSIVNGVALLYATNFGLRRIDVFNTNFQLVGSFTDRCLVRKSYSPFGIQVIDNKVYVTFALRDGDSTDESHGPGLGYVDVFDRHGVLLDRLIKKGPLNASWGLAVAPATGFGQFNRALLVGNFGDGVINAFDLKTGCHLGALRRADGSVIVIDGIWAISFGGNSAANGLSTELYFASGPHDENGGLFGKITVA